MSEFSITPLAGLNLHAPVEEEWDGFCLTEMTGYGFFWFSVRKEELGTMDAAARNHLGSSLPEAGRYHERKKDEGRYRLASAGPGQWFLTTVPEMLPPKVAKWDRLTDQSDGWVCLQLSGSRTREVLEKLISLDLHPDVFRTGSVARSPVDGMHCHIECDDAKAGRYRLHIQRSSARSFVGHIRHAAYSTCGDKKVPKGGNYEPAD